MHDNFVLSLSFRDIFYHSADDEELVCKHKSAIILTPIIKFCTISTKASKQTSTIS